MHLLQAHSIHAMAAERFLDGLAELASTCAGAEWPAGRDGAAEGDRDRASGRARVDAHRGRVLLSPLPRVTLRFPSGVDAAALAEAWNIRAPIAVSGDVHQASWRLAVAGPVLPDPQRRRIEAQGIVFGSWAVTALLGGRPGGDLPDVSAGASPVYDLRERREVVLSISVERVNPGGRLTSAGDPAAVRVLGTARVRNPYARPGWAPAWTARSSSSRRVGHRSRALPLSLTGSRRSSRRRPS